VVHQHNIHAAAPHGALVCRMDPGGSRFSRHIRLRRTS